MTEAIDIEGNLLIQRLHTPEVQEAFDVFFAETQAELQACLNVFILLF